MQKQASTTAAKRTGAAWQHAALPLLCATVVLLFGIWLLVAPQKQYSAEEKRALTTAPAFSAEALFDGSYTAALGEFCADQFPLRSLFVDLKAGCERLLLRGENNGVIIGKEGYLISRQEYTDAQYDTLRQNAATLRRIAAEAQERGMNVVLSAVPRSVDVNRRYLPSLYDSSAADAVWEIWEEATAGMSTASTLEALRAAAEGGEQVWYKTDHHWTSAGAYRAYVTLAPSLGYEPYDESAFEEQTVTDAFFGTTYASAGLRNTAPDVLSLWRYEGDTDYRVVIHGAGGRTLEGLYDLAAAESDDPYNVFLGGTNAYVCVEPQRTELPTLLILKDSYAQSLAPYLARHFRLILVDPRSFKADATTTLWSIIDEQQPDAMLILCGIDTLCGDANLRALLIGMTSRAQQ